MFYEDLKIPSIDSVINTRFYFVSDETLQRNLAINTQYVVFLRLLTDTISGPIVYSIYKNIIIYCASIIEGLINYSIQKLLHEGKVKIENIVSSNTKYVNEKEIYPISIEEKKMLCYVTKTKFYPEISDKTQFKDLNDACKKCGLFDKNLYKKSEELREMRNKIHLKGLEEVDDRYSSKDIDKIFNITTEIINVLEKSSL